MAVQFVWQGLCYKVIYVCAVCMAGSVLQSYIWLCSLYGRVCAAKQSVHFWQI